MSELKKRLFHSKYLTTELLISSFFINLMALASPIFVIQVLGRYVSNGVDGTLVTLTLGVICAVALEFCFRILRARIATAVSNRADRVLSEKTFKVLSWAKQAVLDRLNKAVRQEIMRDLDKVQRAYRASNLTAILDVPFAFLFVLVVALLAPWLALIALVGIGLALLVGKYGLYVSRKSQRETMEASVAKNSLVHAAIHSSDTVRTFNAQHFVSERWGAIVDQFEVLTTWVEHRQNLIQTLTQVVTMLVSIGVIAIGAKLVVSGNLEIGALIGANILAARSVAPFSRVAQMASSLLDAQQSEHRLNEFQQLSLELQMGTAMKKYSGGLEFLDVGFAHPGAPLPLFESFSLQIPAKSFVAFKGPNGAGKTTLGRILLGLLEINRGQILIDNIELRQLSVEWWRQQISYVPQDITFLTGTIEQNITLTNPALTNEQLNDIIRVTDLKEFIDTSAQGLQTVMREQGGNLSKGIRKRIALARALATGGQLVILDEPTESLDEKGLRALFQVMALLRQQGRTMVVFGNDREILGQADIIVDLGVKPTPQIDKRTS